LAEGTSDVAFVWLPLDVPGIDLHPVAEERRCVALPVGHRLATLSEIPLSELLDEPFVAMPESAGSLREWWLGAPERGDRPVMVSGVAETADATLEMVASGLGVALMAAGNADLYARDDVVTRPVAGVRPAVLALAWRAEDRRPAVRDFVRAVSEAIDGVPGEAPASGGGEAPPPAPAPVSSTMTERRRARMDSR
jgi:DNA-binding transcriptional LysR family regulator